MSKKFEVGNRVILTGKGLLPFPDWPVWDSEFSCVGTITRIQTGRYPQVLWDNGHSKILSSNSISHFTGREENFLSPNISFMLYKRSKDAKGR